jgi:PTS system mannose-specific IIA component/PTS system mannose-specific IIB component
MIGLIIGTHGVFSEELLKSSEMIFGSQENVGCITFKPGEGIENLISKYNELIKELNCDDGVLFMVDLYGGSPFNAASMIAMKTDNMEIICGVNLPMVLEVFGSREFSNLSELLVVAENAGKDSIKTLIKKFDDDIEDEL